MRRPTRTYLQIAIGVCIALAAAVVVREFSGSLMHDREDIASGPPQDAASLDAAVEEVRAALASTQGVSMVAQSRDQDREIILVGVESSAYVDEVHRRAPPRARDIPVVVRVMGPVEAQE